LIEHVNQVCRGHIAYAPYKIPVQVFLQKFPTKDISVLIFERR